MPGGQSNYDDKEFLLTDDDAADENADNDDDVDDEDDDEDGEDNGVEIWRWFGAFWPVVRRFRPVSAKN